MNRLSLVTRRWRQSSRCVLLLATVISVSILPRKVSSYLPASQSCSQSYRLRTSTQLQGLFRDVGAGSSNSTKTGTAFSSVSTTPNAKTTKDETKIKKGKTPKKKKNIAALAPPLLDASTSSSPPGTPPQEGIGGQGGYVYDVNRLKRNLLQETVQAYKKELWTLLLQYQTAGTGITEWDVVDKLAALVQASPVRTTTDSNLLDGSWCLAYTSQQSNVADLRRILNIRERTRKKREKNSSRSSKQTMSRSAQQLQQLQEQDASRMNRKGAGMSQLFQTTIMRIHLEELQEDEDAYVQEETLFFGGLLTRTRRWAVRGLTRTSVRLDAFSSQWCIAGTKQIFYKDAAQLQGLSSSSGKSDRKQFSPVPMDMQVVYSDVDLCISSDGDGTDSPFQVFTKNEAWMDPQKRIQRKIQFVVISLQYFLSRLSPGRWIKAPSRRWIYDESDSAYPDPILREYEKDAATMRVLKLGDLSNQDDEAWDGIQDPFVHLSGVERQKVLKSMNFRQIEKAGNRYLAKSWRERWTQRLFRRRKTYFKKPGDM
jgi:hypothetical protein